MYHARFQSQTPPPTRPVPTIAARSSHPYPTREREAPSASTAPRTCIDAVGVGDTSGSDCWDAVPVGATVRVAVTFGSDVTLTVGVIATGLDVGVGRAVGVTAGGCGVGVAGATVGVSLGVGRRVGVARIDEVVPEPHEPVTAICSGKSSELPSE